MLVIPQPQPFTGLALVRSGAIFAPLEEVVDETFFTNILASCDTVDIEQKHYAIDTLLTYTTRLSKLRCLRPDLVERVLDKVTKYWEYPVKSAVMLLHKVLETIATSLTDEQLVSVIHKAAAVSDKHRFRILSEIAANRGSSILLQQCQTIIMDCARAYSMISLATPAVDLFNFILKEQFKFLPIQDWLSLWSDILALPTRLPLQWVIKIDQGEHSIPFILSSSPSLQNLLTVMKTARTLGQVVFTPGGVSVQSFDLPYSKLKEAMGNVDNSIVAECLDFLATTSAQSEALSPVERKLFLFFIKQCLKCSDSQFRQTVSGSVKKLLIRHRLSFKRIGEESYNEFLEKFFNTLFHSIIRTNPFEVVYPTIEVFRMAVQMFGTSPFRLSKNTLLNPVPCQVDIWTPTEELAKSLSLPSDLVRKSAFGVLMLHPGLSEIPLDEEIFSPRLVSYEGAAAYKVLTQLKKKHPEDIDCYLEDIRTRAALLQTFCTGGSEPGLPHGLLCFVRMLLRNSSISPSKDLTSKLIVTIKAVMTSTQSILSKFAVSDEEGYMIDCRGHLITGAPERENLVLMGVWLACKENSMLLEDFADWLSRSKQKTLIAELRPDMDDLGQLTLDVLLSFKHRGAIEKTSLGLGSLCTMLSQTQETSDLPASNLERVLDIIQFTESRTDILRKSAGLPPALLGIVRCGDLASRAIDFFTEHTQEDNPMELRVHCYNILRAIFLDKVLRQKVETRIAQCLALSMHGMASPHWSLRNSSTLLLAAIIERIFGKTTYSMTDLVARNPELNELLQERLSSTGEVFPLLLLISMLKKDRVPRPELVASTGLHLFNRNAMVRGMAAKAVANLALESRLELLEDALEYNVDGVKLVALNNSPNSMQGLLYCIKETLNVQNVEFLTSVWSWTSLRVPGVMQTYLEALQRHQITSVPTYDLTAYLLTSARLRPDIGHSLARIECLKYTLDNSLSSPQFYWNVVRKLINLREISKDPELLEVALVHCKTHLAKVQSDDTEAFCREVLSLQIENSQAETLRKAIVLLRKLSVLSARDYFSLRERCVKFKDNESFTKSTLRALGQTLEPANYADFLNILVEMLEEASDFVKHSAALAMKKDFLLTTPLSWVLVLRLLEDQSKQVRDQMVGVVCKALDLNVYWRPRYLLKLSLKHLCSLFSPEDFLAILVGLADKHLKFGNVAKSAANLQRIFYVEESNTYIERLRLKRLIAIHFNKLIESFPDLANTLLFKGFQQRIQSINLGDLEPEEAIDFTDTLQQFAALVRT